MKYVVNRKILFYSGLAIILFVVVSGIRYFNKYSAGTGQVSGVIAHLLAEDNFDGCTKIINLSVGNEFPEFQCVKAFAIHKKDITICNKNTYLINSGLNGDCIKDYVKETKENVNCNFFSGDYEKDSCFYQTAISIESQTLDNSLSCQKLQTQFSREDCERIFKNVRKMILENKERGRTYLGA